MVGARVVVVVLQLGGINCRLTFVSWAPAYADATKLLSFQAPNVYLVLGVNMDGHKELLGLWLSENEGAKF